MACSRGNTEIVERLLEGYAKLQVRDIIEYLGRLNVQGYLPNIQGILQRYNNTQKKLALALSQAMEGLDQELLRKISEYM